MSFGPPHSHRSSRYAQPGPVTPLSSTGTVHSARDSRAVGALPRLEQQVYERVTGRMLPHILFEDAYPTRARQATVWREEAPASNVPMVMGAQALSLVSQFSSTTRSHVGGIARRMVERLYELAPEGDVRARQVQALLQDSAFICKNHFGITVKTQLD
jgi:hypothetical protein